MTVVALVPSAGPVPPPISVVIPAASATGICCGAIRCTWLSMPPAVRIRPLPAMISVDGPMTRPGVTPSMMSGLPALPRATIRPSRTPTSALITPQWSSTTAPVITRSGVPSARVATDWPIDSRMTLPPPKIASSPASGPGPPQRSSVTSISRSVSASRTRSPAVGPYRAAYRARDISAIERPGRLGPQARDDPRPGQRHQGDLARTRPARTAPTCRPGCPAGSRGPRRGRRTAPGWPRRSGSASRPGSAGHRRSRRSARPGPGPGSSSIVPSGVRISPGIIACGSFTGSGGAA